MSNDITAKLAEALERAFGFGQTYWQEADSESYAANRRSFETLAKFRSFKEEAAASLSPHTEAQAGGTEGDAVAWIDQETFDCLTKNPHGALAYHRWLSVGAADHFQGRTIPIYASAALAAAPAAAQGDVREQFEEEVRKWFDPNRAGELLARDSADGGYEEWGVMLAWESYKAAHESGRQQGPSDTMKQAIVATVNEAVDAAFERGRQQGMAQANALWEMAKDAQQEMTEMCRTIDDMQLAAMTERAEMAKAEQAVPVSSKEAAEALLAAGHEFWLSVGRENYKAQGAVQWLTATDGTLVLFTRGEYKRTLLTNIEALPGSTAVHWGIPGDEDEDERGLLACSHDAAPPATERRPLTREQIEVARKRSLGAASGEIYPELFARAIEAAHNIGTAGTTEQAKEQKT